MSALFGLVAPALSLVVLLALVVSLTPDPLRALHQQPRAEDEPRRRRSRRQRRSAR